MSKEANSKAEAQDQIACVEERQKAIAEIEAKLKENIKKVLVGKCPIRIAEQNGEIAWDFTVLREGFESLTEVYKQLTATTDFEIAQEIILRGVSALPKYMTIAKRYNIILQVLADNPPKDATEARLIVQCHALFSKGMRELSSADDEAFSDYYVKNATKLLRLHNETLEALSKYRRGGEQRVIVQHVNVEGGGQAIVNNGNLNAAPGGGGK